MNQPAALKSVTSTDGQTTDILVVGRDREIAILVERIRLVRSGTGTVILIGGEAGIGKTALAELALGDAVTSGMLGLIGRCYDLSETLPYGPWREVFGQMPADDALPELPAAVLPPDRDGVALGSQDATHARVRSYLALVSARRPLFILLDDFQWADRASLDLFRMLARDAKRLPIILVVTYRGPDGQDRSPFAEMLPTLVRESHPERLDLSPMTADAIRTFIDLRYVLPEPDARQLASFLAQRSDGNPFFVEELLRTLHEQRGLVATPDGWRIGDVQAARVPALIEQVLAQRLQKFTASERQSLSVAALIGQDVPIESWRKIVELPEPTAFDLIERGVASGVLVTSDDGTRVSFRHALTRDVLHDALLPPRRRAWHRVIAEMLESLPGAAPDVVAYHYERAGDPRAVTWLIHAGEQAEQAYAYLTAAERYEVALQQTSESAATSASHAWLLLRLAWLRFYQDAQASARLADDVLRATRDAGEVALVASALVSRGHFRVTGGDFPAGLADIRAGVGMLDESAAALAEWDSHLAQPPSGPIAPFRPHGVLTASLAYCGRLREACETAERSLTLSRSAANRRSAHAVGEMQAFLGLGIAAAGLGDLERSRMAFADARAAIEPTQQHLLTSIVDLYDFTFRVMVFHPDAVGERRRLIGAIRDAWSRASGVYADEQLTNYAATMLLFFEGRWDVLRDLARHGQPPPPIRLFQYSAFGELAYASGETDRVWRLIHEVLPSGPTSAPGFGGFNTLLAYQRLAARLALDSGDLPAARRWLDAHDRLLEWSGSVIGRSEGRLTWARYSHAARDTPQAIHQALQARTLATQPRQPIALLAAQRALAEFLIDEHELDRAEESITDALALAAACDVPYERALTSLVQARLLHARSLAAEAGTVLNDAIATFTSLGALPNLSQAAALAAQLARTESHPRGRPAGLSIREIEVLRLVAAGRSNRAIAEILGLSPHTVHSHLRHIYDKTGCENRAAVTAFALRHELA